MKIARVRVNAPYNERVFEVPGFGGIKLSECFWKEVPEITPEMAKEAEKNIDNIMFQVIPDQKRIEGKRLIFTDGFPIRLNEKVFKVNDDVMIEATGDKIDFSKVESVKQKNTRLRLEKEKKERDKLAKKAKELREKEAQDKEDEAELKRLNTQTRLANEAKAVEAKEKADAEAKAKAVEAKEKADAEAKAKAKAADAKKKATGN